MMYPTCRHPEAIITAQMLTLESPYQSMLLPKTALISPWSRE